MPPPMTKAAAGLDEIRSIVWLAVVREGCIFVFFQYVVYLYSPKRETPTCQVQVGRFFATLAGHLNRQVPGELLFN
jgi:hypothetical protein